MKMASVPTGLALALVLVVSLGCGRAIARPWTIADVHRVATIDDVKIDPQGERILYAATRADMRRGVYVSTWKIVPVAGGVATVLRLPAPYVALTSWSPDSRSIAFLIVNPAKNRTAQVWVYRVSQRRWRQVTHGVRTIDSFSWSHDGRHFAATEHRETAEDLHVTSRWLSPKSDGTVFLTPVPRGLWIIDAGTGEQRPVRDGGSFGSEGQQLTPAWSPDDREVVVGEQPTPYYSDFEHFRYIAANVRTGAISPAIPGTYYVMPLGPAPVFMKNRLTYVRTADGTGTSRSDIFAQDANLTARTDRDFWSCTASRMVTDGTSTLLASALDGITMRLFRITEGGAVPVPTRATGSVGAFSVARNGLIAYALSTPSRPQELYISRPDGTRLRQISHENALDGTLEISPTRAVAVASKSGHTLVAQLTVPATLVRRTPLLTQVHGGPQCSDDTSFSPWVQYFASNGYAFLRPNPRGGDGYGNWSYKAIVNDWADGPTQDVMDTIDTVLADGIGDPRRLYLEGASYGGYLTAWIVTHGNRFRAAVAGFPVTDLAMAYELTRTPGSFRRFFGRKPIAENGARLAAQSPITYAANLHTPLLLLAGLRDAQSPYPPTIAFYKTLLDDGKDVRMLVYPNAAHDSTGLAEDDDILKHLAGWLAAHGGIQTPDALLP